MRIANNTAELTVDTQHGGRVSSLRIYGLEILVTEAEAASDWGFYPMAPWAGRVREGSFDWAGSPKKLPINAPPHALHGTVFDAEWTQTGPNSLCCSLGKHWPWGGEVRSTLTLSNEALDWSLEVHSESEPFPVVVGWHPWFRRRLGSGEPLRLHWDAQEMYARDEEGIPTGALCEPSAPPWDDCFRGLRRSPELLWPGRLLVRLQSSCDHWVVYSEPRDAICIEPQSGPPNAFNIANVETVEPGRPLVHSFRLQWERPESGGV